MEKISVKIKRFDRTLPLPEYKTAGAAAFDLYSRTEVTINPGEIGYIPLNVAVEVPDGYWTMLAARSSTHKLGLLPANGLGIMDADYCGDEDEYILAALNFTKQPVTIAKGTRLAQAIVMPQVAVKLVETNQMNKQSRGAFGTTGNN